MCGICGMINTDGARPADVFLVEAMLSRLAHRGPDGQGIVKGRGAALGHRRLAIIDLSESAAQPLSSEDGTVAAAVNGEIYNHRELRGRLESMGHRFRSRTDSEVVVHLYEEHGPEAIERLEGMFAIALWDGKRESLLLARDRMGEKPLYYHENAARLLFASELGALLADPGLAAEADDLAIHHYLTFRFVPSPHTGLRGVRKIPPGHLLQWERGRGGEAALRRYARPPRPADARAQLQDRGLDPTEAVRPHRVREAIGLSVRNRLESDVPIGVLLSGGLDSAIVALEASRAAGRSLRTFTVGFDESDYDESEGAAAVARHIGSDHHPLRATADVAAELPAMASRFGEPLGDSSAAAVWLLAREVRRHVTVALGGDGGDELFGGYDRHRALQLYRTLRRGGMGPIVSLVSRIAAALPLRRMRRNLPGRLERFGRGVSLDLRDANCALLSCFTDAQKHSLYTPELAGRMAGVDSMSLLRRFYDGEGDALEDVLYTDLSLSLPDDLLFKVDVASMASALEVRSPFLDSDVVRLAMAVPVSSKVGPLRGKMVLRDAYSGLLPQRTLRGRKAGFGLPIDRWLRGPLRELSCDLLLDGRLATRGHFDGRAVMELLKEHDSGRINHDDRIWALLCLELWFRSVVEGRAEVPAETAGSRTGEGAPLVEPDRAAARGR